jgi:hypothetical protein
MTTRTKSTVKMLIARSGIANAEIPEEAQKLLTLCDDPNVAPEQKAIARSELDRLIREIEERVTSRRLKAVTSGDGSEE